MNIEKTSFEQLVLPPKIYKMFKIIALLSVIAMGVTLWLTYIHYKPVASEFCNFNEQWNCEIVNKSQWSTLNLSFAEIPVAILGFVTYLILFIGTVGIIKKWRFEKIHSWLRIGKVIDLMRYLTYIGLLFSLYLTYIEVFKLHTFCLFCVIQQVIIVFIVGLFLMISKNRKR